MRTLIFLASVSAAAILAAPAEAQTTSTVGTNQSTVTRTGTGNSDSISNAAPGNDENRAVLVQDGNGNNATVEQIGDFNDSDIAQRGDQNRATHRQTGNRNKAASSQQGDGHSSHSVQGGDSNVATVTQSGRASNSSLIDQREAEAEGSGVTQGREAKVTQLGSGNASTIQQVGDVKGAASANIATVVQGSALLPSHGAFSNIRQQSRGNRAEAFLFEGSEAARNRSTITQTDRAATATDSTASNNYASLSVRGYGNEAVATQDGRDNRVEISMLAGGTAAGAALDSESGRTEGNRSTVNQSGEGAASARRLTAAISVGARTAGEGRGNLNSVRQTGFDHRTEIWQRGNFDTVSVQQGNQGDLSGGVDSTPKTYSDGTRSRAHADVSQRGLRGSVNIFQYSDNFAQVTQGLGARNSTVVRQIDTGDFSTPAGPADAGARAFNTALVAQYGDGNVTDVDQEAKAARSIVWQKLGSSLNRATISQGVTRHGIAGGDPVLSGGSNLVAEITQGGAGNDGSIVQNGDRNDALLEQFGRASTGMPNRIRIQQLGQNNRASAKQTASVEASEVGDPASGNSAAQNAAASGGAITQADEFYFAGGARSAEIDILQSSFGNVATVEQRGRGQFAMIRQSGENNTASIFQDSGATNATAVIRQTGNQNSYSVAQTMPGQYIVVTQRGNGNQISSVVQRGP